MVTQREKLIEILSQYFTIGDSDEYSLLRDKSAFAIGTMSLEDFVEFDDEKVADIADYLLANGVVVLPCKEGDTLHRVVIPKYDAKPFIFGGIDVVEVIGAGCKSPFGGYSFVPFDDFGKTVFLKREEAEVALKKMEGEE